MTQPKGRMNLPIRGIPPIRGQRFALLTQLWKDRDDSGRRQRVKTNFGAFPILALTAPGSGAGERYLRSVCFDRETGLVAKSNVANFGTLFSCPFLVSTTWDGKAYTDAKK
jgi:hypothetical protein